MSAWTPDEDALLTRLKIRGDSYARIGERLKKSRNACIGRGRRLGFVESGEAVAAKRQMRKEQRETLHKSNEPRRYRYKKPPAPFAEPSIPTYRAGDIEPLGGYEFPESCHCKYIHGDPLSPERRFCARPVKDGSVWCQEHHALFYTRSIYVLKNARAA